MNPLYYISGVEAEAKEVPNEPKLLNILTLFSLFVIVALLAGFLCFYYFGKYYLSTGAGIALGLGYACLVIMMDRLLFKSGGMALAIGRIVAIIVLSFITGATAGITSGKSVIENRIDKNTGYQNVEYQNIMQGIDNKYKKEIEGINVRMLDDIRKNPENDKEIKEVFREMKIDNEREREREKETARIKHKIEQPDYSLGNVVITYFNKLGTGEKFNGFYWLFFILEFMPLFWKGVYHLAKEVD